VFERSTRLPEIAEKRKELGRALLGWGNQETTTGMKYHEGRPLKVRLSFELLHALGG
jgi:hypothetical protein